MCISVRNRVIGLSVTVTCTSVYCTLALGRWCLTRSSGFFSPSWGEKFRLDRDRLFEQFDTLDDTRVSVIASLGVNEKVGGCE